MLKTNVFALIKDTNNYVSLICLLEDHFKEIEIHSQEKRLIDNIERFSHSANTNNLLILFVEFPFLQYVSKYLLQALNPENYILISFYPQHVPHISKYPNLFEYINTTAVEFDYIFFFNKLTMEISNKNRISLLQFEVREFYEIGKSLTSEKDMVKLLEMIINSSISLTSSDAGTIYLIVDNKNQGWTHIKNHSFEDKMLKFVISKNMSMDINLEASVSPITRESIFGYAVITGKSLRIDDAYNLSPDSEYRHNQTYDLSTGYITKSMLTIPMKDYENNVIGVIQLINKKKSKNSKLDFRGKASLKDIIPYDSTDELIMNSLAGQAAVALENNLLYRDMQNLLQSYRQQNEQLAFLSRKILKAHEEERKRIAREIHDGPAQSIVNLALKLELCKKYADIGNLEKIYSEMDIINSNIRSTSREIRTIIYNLKPSYLEDGIINALENQLEVFKETTGLNAVLNAYGDDTKIEYYLTSTIYRIVQEALTNIFKHAKAHNVRINFNITPNEVQIQIIDDGKGFDISKLLVKNHRSVEGGFGLDGIRERVEIVKGDVEINSAPGKGTIITVNIPLL